MRISTVVTAAAVLFLSSSGFAADECPLNGTKITLTSFASAYESLRRIPREKGEFESTDVYEKRVAALEKSIPSTFLLRIGGEGRTPYDGSTVNNEPSISYDADTQEL